MNTFPDDFAFEYQWSEGSLPPPYHYEYLIRVKPYGAGEVVFWPDYPAEAVPAWTETFSVTSEQLEQLYQLMVAQRLFDETWQAQDDPPVGGSTAWLTVSAQGRKIEIPPFVLPEQADQAAQIYTAVRALAPEAIWARLERRRQEYWRQA